MLKLRAMNLKQPINTFTNTTRFGCVPNGRKRRFQDCKCKDVGN